ncbi:MAG: hypothetical protein NE334_16180 [Lentisphaeraceae bacterium]|nr:hypothetical protein [Lentisphaeraceae bacterium]
MAARQEKVESYRQKITDLSSKKDSLSSGEGQFTTWRLLTFAVTALTLAFALLDGRIPVWSFIFPGALFGFVVAIHERKLSAVKTAQKQIDFYEAGIRRIEGDWQEDGSLGEEFIDKDHLFSGDLNLFGRASLFQKISRCITTFGQQRLAKWLLNPELPEKLAVRQEAVAELSQDQQLFDSYAELDSEEVESLDIETLKSWSSQGANVNNPFVYFLSLFLGMCSVATLVSWLFLGKSALPFFICLILDLLLGQIYGGRIAKITEGIASKEKNLLKLATVLRVLESRDYKSELMIKVINDIRTENIKASDRIEQIAHLIYSFENTRSNLAIQPFNLLLHINLRNAMKIDKWRKVAGESIPQWVEAAADFEALLSLAVFRNENPDYNFPEFVKEGPYFVTEDMGHPLLKPKDCVRNTVKMGQPVKLLLISGSNMAGKSTFLRTIGVNIVLAQAGAPVNAKSMSLSPLSLGCSIQIEDSLSEGISHFYAEILRLKKLVDLSNSSQNVMFFFDEILHGTNSSDRCNGASAVIKSLVENGASGFVTTHDLSLTSIADDLNEQAQNVHFEDQFEDGKMVFDYKMKDGVVTHGNALQLMRSLGLEV